jgi:O-antigen/teichoic acid export membrane protein
MKTFIYIISGSFFLSFSQIKLAIYRSEYKSLLFVVLAISSNGVPLLVTTFISRFTNLEPISIYFFTLYLSVIIFTQPFRYSSFNQQISLKPLIQSSYPMIAHGIAISLFQYGDKIAGYFGSNSLVAAEIAILSLILTGPVLLLNTLNNVWLPTSLESYKKRKSVGISNSNQIANKIAFLISLIIIVLLLLIDKISIFYISRTYDYYSIEKTIIGSLFITPLYVMYLQNSHLITVKKNFQILGIITPITSAVQFFLTYIFVNSIGLIAVGYGFIAGITLQVLLTTIFTKNAKNLGLNPIFYSLALGVFSYFLYAFRF